MGENDEKAKPILVMREHRTRWTETVAVQTKGGSDSYCVRAVVGMIRRVGVQRFLFKSDLEPAIIELKKQVATRLAEHGVEAVMEVTPVDDHQANGTIERAVQTVAGMVRTHKLATELPYTREIGSDHPIMPWIIEHAAAMVTLFEVSADGRTAYERVRGKRWRQPLPAIGECVFYLPIDRNRGKGGG